MLVVANHALAALYSASNRSVDLFHGQITQEFLLLAPMLFGKAAVGLFFLLSGYLVGASKNIFGRVVAQVARVGSWSYTLYIFHMPLLFFIGIAWASFALPANPLVAYGLFFAVLPIAYMFYSLVEARTPQIRAFLVKVTEVRN